MLHLTDSNKLHVMFPFKGVETRYKIEYTSSIEKWENKICTIIFPIHFFPKRDNAEVLPHQGTKVKVESPDNV